MYVQQLYTNCLAHAAYYIESAGEAAIIDPLRDYEQYTQLAASRGSKIKYIIETHFHADFVSGHIDLANKTGATIVFGPGANPGYKADVAEDGEILNLGKCKLRILHTPGHTLESICIELLDEHGHSNAVFTGDTLFVGDVGRPDLMSGNLSKEELAGMLFDSLANKLKPLAEDVIVYPGHGAGSACGKNIGKETQSTIGDQKKNNYAMLETDKQHFIDIVASNLPVPPPYFFKDAAINKKGYESVDEVIKKNLHALSIDKFKTEVEGGATVLDTRDPMHFANAHVKGAINIGLTGDFTVWVGTMIDIESKLLLVTHYGKELEAITRLSRIGFDNVTGYLEGGMDAWIQSGGFIENVMTITPNEVTPLLDTENYELLDVRNRLEVARNRMAGATHIPLNELKRKLPTLDRNKKWLIYCAGGYRSMIAASVMQEAGFENVASIEGGINKMLATTPELVDLEEVE